jgi:hypothetical protein
MPEQNTPTPIRREDIQVGDRIRQSIEYTVTPESLGGYIAGPSYELIDRPVALPTETGYYLDKFYEMWSFESNGMHRLEANIWHTVREAEEFAPFERVMQITETARQVLVDVRNIFGGPASGALLHKEVDKIAAKFGVVS